MAGRSTQDCTEISALLGPEGWDLLSPANQQVHQDGHLQGLGAIVNASAEPVVS
jgi:hypothetical protein